MEVERIEVSPKELKDQHFFQLFPYLKSVAQKSASFRMAKMPSSGQRACLPSTPCPLGPGAATTMLSWLASRSEKKLFLLVFFCGLLT